MGGGRLPRITVAELQCALGRAGWYQKRAGANHQILTHPDKGGRVDIPRHPSQTLKPKTLLSILDQAGLTIDELRTLLWGAKREPGCVRAATHGMIACEIWSTVGTPYGR